MDSGGLLVVIGLDREPTLGLAADLRHLNYQAEVIAWPVLDLRLRGPRPFAALVDLRVLGVEASRVCQALRNESTLRKMPLIAMVSEQEAPRLDLSLGFDELILAPYRLSELAVRLRLVRWRNQPKESLNILQIGPISVNQATYEVIVDNRPIALTLKEYQLLLFLMRNPNRVFTREELLSHVWGDDYYGGTRTVDVHIRRLRAKTEEGVELIETVRGVGYRIVVPK